MKNIFVSLIMAMMFPSCAQNHETNIQSKVDDMKINIIIGEKEFTAILYDNETAKALLSKLPITVIMNELNGNEKYYNFPQNLSSGSAQRLGTINKGDIMLWSSNCLVLFYKTFYTNYGYMKIGRIENTDGLEAAVGKGDVEVTFAVDN